MFTRSSGTVGSSERASRMPFRMRSPSASKTIRFMKWFEVVQTRRPHRGMGSVRHYQVTPCGLDLPWRVIPGEEQQDEQQCVQEADVSDAYGLAAGGSNGRPLLRASATDRSPPGQLALSTDRTRRADRWRRIGRYDLDVPAAVRYQLPGLLQRSWNRPRLRVTFPAVSCAVIRNLIGPPPAASRRPFWPGARAASKGISPGLTLPHHARFWGHRYPAPSAVPVGELVVSYPGIHFANGFTQPPRPAGARGG